MTPVTAPDDTTLRQFLLGMLPPAEAAAVEQWLERNPDASVRLRSLGAHDTVTDAINGEANTSVGGTAVQTAVPQAALPLSVGSYRVLRELGRGGMGVVLEAEDAHLKRRVAIKLIATEFAGSAPARERFLREAQSVARIDHPNVVPVHHVGEHAGQLYLVMPLLKGETLDTRLRREKKLSAAEVMRIGREVAAGLAAAHAVGLIHRDVKPANIWLDADTGRARVLDFGLAKPLDQSTDGEPLTSAGAVIGTLHYMSPQQANGESLDERTDLFSLGAVLHHAATGVKPFDGPTKFAVLYAVVNDTPSNLEALREALPVRVAEVVSELLEKRPDARPKSAADVIARLTDTPPVVAVPVPAPASPWEAINEADDYEADTEIAYPPAPVRRAPRWKGLAIAAGLLLAVAAVAATVVIIRDKNGKEVARLEVPEGGSVEVKPLPLPPVRVPPADAPAANADADRRTAEWVLSVGGGLRVRADGIEGNVASVDALPKVPFHVVAVNVGRNPKVNDTALTALKGCKHLRELHLYLTAIGRDGLANIRDCTELRVLNLEGTRTDNAALEHLANCQQLTELNLCICRSVDDLGLTHLKGNRNLTHLNLAATKVTDAGLALFAGCDKLQLLNVTDTAVTDAGLAHFARYKHIETLHLQGSKITDVSLARFKNHPKLRLLQVGVTAVTDTGLAALAGCAELRELDLKQTKVTATGVAALAKALPNCRIEWDGGTIDPAESADRKAAEWVLSLGGKIRVAGSDGEITVAGRNGLPKGAVRLATVDFVQDNATDAGLAVFVGCTELIDLNLSGCRDVTDAGLMHFKGCTKLQDLNVYLTQVTDAGLAHLKGCTQLGSLDVSATKVTDKGLAALAAHTKLFRLTANATAITDAGLADLDKHAGIQFLYLNDTKLTDAGLKRLAAFKKLAVLQIDGTAITDAGLVALAKSETLRAVDVRNTKVTKAGVAALAKALPYCRIEWDGGTIEPKK